MKARNIATAPPPGYIQLPDAPEREDMNNWKFFNSQGNGAHLARHFGNENTTIILSDAYIATEPTSSQAGLFLPDLLIAFDVNPAACYARNGYVISEQGKPPDFVLEIGSKTTGQRDATEKRDGYARLGVREYWRFDPSGGSYQGAPLAGDRLTGSDYEPIQIEQINANAHQGYSTVLHLHLRWEHGQLMWHDPETERHIPTFDDERARAEAAEAARLEAEARVRELEAELERRRRS